MKTKYLNGSDLIDKMLELGGITQKELARELEVSEAAISGYRKTNVSKKSIKRFLHLHPEVGEDAFIEKESNGYIKNLQDNIGLGDEGTMEFAEALMNVSAKFGTKRYIIELKGRRHEILNRLFSYSYENNEVSGYLSKDYRLRVLEREINPNKIKIMPYGFCTADLPLNNCKNCFACHRFITTKEFVPVLKAFKLTIDSLADLNSFRDETPLYDNSYYSKDINSVLSEFI